MVGAAAAVAQAVGPPADPLAGPAQAAPPAGSPAAVQDYPVPCPVSPVGNPRLWVA